jgi:hypothetical protein
MLDFQGHGDQLVNAMEGDVDVSSVEGDDFDVTDGDRVVTVGVVAELLVRNEPSGCRHHKRFGPRYPGPLATRSWHGCRQFAATE